MRKLMWFSLGLALMCACVAYLNIAAAGVICVLAFIGAVIGFTLGHKDKRLRLVVLVCTGLIVGFLVGFGNICVNLNQASALNGKINFITAQVTDYSFETDYGSAVIAEAEIDGKTYAVQLYLNDVKELQPGDTVSGKFRMRYTGGEDGTYHFGRGILILGYQRGSISVRKSTATPPRLLPAVLRRNIECTIDRIFPEDTSFFARALLLGDRTDMGYELNTAFKVTGISHIIAVSGLHVSMLASAVYLLAGKKRWLMAILGIPTVLLFAAIVGFTPSITRACMMQILLLIALVLDRDYDPLTSLAFAACIMLTVNPMCITSVSFQLSFGCMAGIFLFSGKIYDSVTKWDFWKHAERKSFLGATRRWIAGSISVSLGSMIFTTLLCAIYFGSISLIGVLTNLLVLWLVGLIFPGILLVCVIALIHNTFAVAMAWILSWPIRILLGFILWLADFPLAAVYTQSIWIVLWLAIVYAVLLFSIVTKFKYKRIAACICCITLCVAMLVSWSVPGTNDYRMTVLDVGQGQCVILTAKGRTFLIDCGGEYDEDAADIAAETLLSQGIFRLNGVILSHYDRDHAGGVAYLLGRIPTDQIYLPDTASVSASKDAIHVAARGRVTTVQKDMSLRWDDCQLTIFAPVLSSSDNESGISVLFTGENCDILITGDMNELGEKLLLNEKQIPALDVLVAGHHGSKHSTGERLLQQTMPEKVFISVGRDNSYGHPAQEVLDRLEKYGCEIHRTDLEGTIVFRR